MMKVLIVACLLIVSASSLEQPEVEFRAFKLKHGKTYKSQVEETKRFNIFTDNLRSIKRHNALYELGLVSYKQGVNKFTDMTQEEFKSFLTLSTSDKPHFNTSKHINTGLAVPSSVDWRNDGQVTEIKDEGNCNSGWAFSVTGSTEAAFKRKSGKLVSLSEQQLVDCATDGWNKRCDGGYVFQTFSYVEKNGLESEDSYPYNRTNGNCNYSSSDVVTKIVSYKSIEKGNEDALLDAVANVGPVSVDIDASYLSSYLSGIFEDNVCDNEMGNHDVLVVGYGSEDGKKYWIVKNSWGSDFGENGYFRILRGTNECAIATEATYPVID